MSTNQESDQNGPQAPYSASLEPETGQSASGQVDQGALSSSPQRLRETLAWLLGPFAPQGGHAVPGAPSLSAPGLRRALRTAIGAVLGFVISQLMDWNYGVFFTVFPMFLLGMVPRVNGHVMRQFIGSALVNCVEVSLVVGFLHHWPLIMTGVVFVLFYTRFALMARGPMFLFGANGILTLSVMLHFGSYVSVDLFDLMMSTVVASVLAVAIALLMWQLIPEHEAITLPARGEKSLAQIRHETVMGASMATLSFVVFQTLDLRDSLSAQMATILILFSLHYPGAMVSAQKRAMGTFLGSLLAIVMQLLLYTHANNLVLVTLFYFIGLMLFARAHILEGGASGVGFGGMTTMGILFGQYVSPHQDLVYSAFYRISSVSFALLAGLVVMSALHRVLNRFEPVRSDVHF